MAANVTLSDLRTEVRRRGEYRAPYITDDELNSYINGSLAHLRDILIHEDPSRYMTQGTISVVSGTESYTLPADFFQVVSVNIPTSNSSTGYAVADRIAWKDRHYWLSGTATNKEDTKYTIRNNRIYFSPVPSWTDTVQFEFVPAFADLTADADTFDGINGWEEWVINDVLIKCAAKASDDARPWQLQRQLTEERIQASGDTDQAQPKTVRNIYRRSGYRGRRWRY